MKAALLTQINGPLAVDDITLGALAEGQVLVKILVTGICGFQLQELAGTKGNPNMVPRRFGHEACGIVEQTGPGVKKVKRGDKVVLHWRKGDGIESDFPVYSYKGKSMTSGKITTFSEYSICSENRMTPVADDIPDDVCALLGCGLSTALATFEHEADLHKGESVLVVGVGGLGACVIKAAKIMGAHPIVAIDVHDKAEAARSLGADIFINTKEQLVADALTAHALKNFNVIIETSGNVRAIEDTIPHLAPSGRYIMVGQPKPGQDAVLKNVGHLFDGDGKMIRATQGGKFSPSTDIPRYIELYRSGSLNIEGIISNRATLDTINDAVKLMKGGSTQRIMIDIWRS